MNDRSETVGIRRVESEMEGLQLRDLLVNEGINCELFSFHDTALDGISQNWSEGDWGELRVFKEDKEKAIRILEDYEKSKPEDTAEE